ncbi:DUF4203 domain-containing protein [Nakamurella sp.]|uniref:DUF4203 domain-containing protein n=1 Tax=Nakamurella sp. TaxID=1869182 RepID=UPI00378395A7
MTEWVVVGVGVVLCFFGIGSVHLAIMASGFGLGWLLADLFGASGWTTLLVAAGSALILELLVALVFKVARFVVGMVAGSLIGAKLYSVSAGADRTIVLAAVVVIATALVFGFLADKFRERVLLWATAIGGAGLILSAIGLIWPDSLGFLRHPTPGGEQALSTALWVALAAAGWLTQRRLFPKALNLRRARDDEDRRERVQDA